MDRQVCLVLLLLTSVKSAPPVPYARAAMDPIGRLGLAMSAETITDVAATRDEPSTLEERGILQREATSASHFPNYWTPPQPSRGRAQNYLLIPIHDPYDQTTVQSQRHASIPSLQGSQMSNMDLVNYYKLRASSDNNRPTIFPIHINVPESVNAMSTWFSSIPFVYRWQQSQVNDPRIYIPMFKPVDGRNGMFLAGTRDSLPTYRNQVSSLPVNILTPENFESYPQFNNFRHYQNDNQFFS